MTRDCNKQKAKSLSKNHFSSFFIAASKQLKFLFLEIEHRYFSKVASQFTELHRTLTCTIDVIPLLVTAT